MSCLEAGYSSQSENICAGAYGQVYRGLLRGEAIAVKIIRDLEMCPTEDGVPFKAALMQLP